MYTCAHTHTHTLLYAGAIFFIIFKEKNWAALKSLLTAYKAQVMNVSLDISQMLLFMNEGFQCNLIVTIVCLRETQKKKENYFKWFPA